MVILSEKAAAGAPFLVGILLCKASGSLQDFFRVKFFGRLFHMSDRNAPAEGPYLPLLGLDFSCGFFHIPFRERLRLIRAAGFDTVMITLRADASESALPADIFAASQRCGLLVNTVHAPTEHAADLWRDTLDGAAYAASLQRSIRFCGERGTPNLVVHTTRALLTPPPNALGVSRAARAAEAAEKYGVNLAWENTRFPDYNAYLYERVASPRMRLCFDCGHAAHFTPEEDLLARFGERLSVLHLHDNHGPLASDEHLLPGDGTIDFPALMRRLKPYRPPCLHLESRIRTDGSETEADAARYYADAYARVHALAEL